MHGEHPDPARQLFAIITVSVGMGLVTIPMQYMGGKYAGPIKWELVVFAFSYGFVVTSALFLLAYFERSGVSW